MIATDTADQADVKWIAAAMIDQGWAACVQIVDPIRSFNGWEGVVESANKWQLTIKTGQEIANQVVERCSPLVKLRTISRGSSVALPPVFDESSNSFGCSTPH